MAIKDIKGNDTHCTICGKMVEKRCFFLTEVDQCFKERTKEIQDMLIDNRKEKDDTVG